MFYKNIVEGKFISRINRFVACVEIEGKVEKCHVKNTGRLKELLVPDAKVYLEHSNNKNRKTAYSLISVQKGERIINIDSQAPNKAFYEGLLNNKIHLEGLNKDLKIKAEQKYGNSRFDFYLENNEQKAFVEVKGVTLEIDNIAKFPDAPTERGVKHIMELIKAQQEGYKAFIIFIIQMSNIDYFTPNDETQKSFREALKLAKDKGVGIYAYECDITPDSICVNGVKCPVYI